jgi:hypothetical protein
MLVMMPLLGVLLLSSLLMQVQLLSVLLAVAT